ncbi:MAG: Bug family tripartite tricarboxylate transporter substrate binding protein [Beijerinckiaceae bacterium]
MQGMKALLPAAIAAAALTGLPAAAQSDADFYKGKGITIMLGHPPGGSFDLYARLAVEFMKRYIPGNNTILIQYKPGGGGVVAGNYFFANAPRDGSMIALFPETIAHTQMMESNIAKWDVAKMAYIGSFAPVGSAFVLRAGANAKTIQDAKTIETTVGCSGKASQSYQYPAMLKNLGGYNLKLICGYKGSKAFVLAAERGEVDLVSSAWNNWRSSGKQLLSSGKMKVVLQTGLKRDKELAEIPLMQEIVTDPQAKKVIEFVSSAANIGRALIAPPGVPVSRIALLRKAFDDMSKDKDFLAAAEKRGAVIDPTPGAEVQELALKILAAQPDLVAAAAKSMQ